MAPRTSSFRLTLGELVVELQAELVVRSGRYWTDAADLRFASQAHRDLIRRREQIREPEAVTGQVGQHLWVLALWWDMDNCPGVERQAQRFVKAVVGRRGDPEAARRVGIERCTHDPFVEVLSDAIQDRENGGSSLVASRDRAQHASE